MVMASGKFWKGSKDLGTEIAKNGTAHRLEV